MTQADQNRSLYLTIVERAFVLGGHGKGVGEPMLPWKDKFNEVSRTFQLGLGAWVRRFLSVRLGFRAGRVYLVQDVYVTSSKTHMQRGKNRRTFFRKANRNYGSVGYQIRAGVE